MTASAGAAWVSAQVMSMGDDLQRSVGFDFLLGEGYTQPWDVDRARGVYAEGLLELLPVSAKFMLALVIPLAPVDRLWPEAPDIASLDVHEMEPPSLYVFDRRFFGACFNDFEEYRVPVESSGVVVPLVNVRAYYSCFRDPQARAQDWEFSRAIWYQHFHRE